MRKNRLIHDTLLYAIANFSSVILNFLMLPFYTWYFSPEEFGIWDIALTTSALLTPIVTLELVSATYRWLIEERDITTQRTIITTGFFQLCNQLFVINLITIPILSAWTIPYGWQFLIFLDLTIITNFFMHCTRALHRNFLFAILSLLQTSIILSVNLILILKFELRIESFFYAHIISGIVLCLIIFLKLPLRNYMHQPIAILKNLKGKQEKGFSLPLLRAYYAYALPMIPAAVSWWFMTLSDRWIIAIFLTIKENGIYAIALKIPAVLLMINTVFSLAWKDQAILSFKQKEKNEYYSLVFKRYFRLLCIAVIILTLLSKPIIILFIDEAYHEAWKYSGPLLIGSLFHSLSLFWSAGFHGAKQTGAILRSSIIGALINVILNLLLISSLGLYAIAVSTAISFFITWTLRVKEARGYFNITIQHKELCIFILVILGLNFIILYY